MEIYVWIAVICALIFSTITFLFCDYYAKKYLKYIPSILILISVIYCLIKILFFSKGVLDLSYVILFTISLLAFLCSLSTLTTVGVVRKIEHKHKHHKK